MGPPGFRPPENPKEGEEEVEEVQKPELPPEPKGPPKPETPWERGLRQAKEVRVHLSRMLMLLSSLKVVSVMWSYTSF